MQQGAKILVTGGAGYIGSHTIISLLSQGYEVVSLDNYSNSTPETYRRVEKITGKTLTYIAGDCCDKATLEQLFRDHTISGIIHFAAYKSVPESVEKPQLYYRNNILSLATLLDVSTRAGVRHFIFSSSCSVYGNIGILPVSEETPLGELQSPYAETKLIGENLLQYFAVQTPGLKTIALRYFNPVGAHPTGWNGELPRNRPNNLVPFITQVAIGKFPELAVYGDDYDTRDGSCIRDYVHVCDIADAHVAALQYLAKNTDLKNYDIINLGTGTGVTVFEAIKAFERENGQSLPYKVVPRRAGDVAAIYADSHKAEALLHWKPKLGIAEMMRSAWKWEQHLQSEAIAKT